jgi:hypothetical protein
MASRRPRPTALLVIPAFLALVWAVAAAIRPSSTFHLAPILVTLTATAFAGADTPLRHLRRMPAYGATISLATAFGIGLADWGAGPSLLPFGDATMEAVVLTLGAAALGRALLWRRRVSPV